MKLYYSPGACSLAPHIVLREAAVPFTLQKVDTAKHVTAEGEDFYAVNPKGYVPLLELEDGSRLSEGAVIAQYIAEKAGNTTLLPATGSMARYRVLEWQNYITSEIHKGFGPLFNPAFDANAKAVQTGLLLKKLEWVDSQLQKTSYLTGENFTVADVYLFVVANWSKYVNLDISKLANLQRFLGRVAARPAVHEALKAEGLLS